MGLMDFLKKGKEAPAPEPKKQDNNNPSILNTQNHGHNASAQQQPTVQQQTQAQPQRTQPATQPMGTAQAAPALQPEIYTVRSGDSLSKIAKQVYGNANQWNKIYQANQDIIKNPDMIHPGQKLVIPR